MVRGCRTKGKPIRIRFVGSFPDGRRDRHTASGARHNHRAEQRAIELRLRVAMRVPHDPVTEEGAEDFTEDGWFKTGDIVSIDEHGFINIQDRDKDLVKSGGEWISSVQLENALEADDMFRTLMGEKVEPRRDFIQKHALEVKDIDYHGA